MELNKAVLDCMKDLRRRLRAEQQLDIRLSQPDVIEAILSACLKSNDETTRDLGRLLASYSDQPFSLATQPASEPTIGHSPSVRIYRGQRVIA